MLNYLRTKGKGITVYLFFLVALAIFVGSALVGCELFDKWFGILGGVLLMLLAIPCHIFIGKRTIIGYFLSFALNTIGAGFSVSAYYIVKDVNCQIDKLICGIIPAVLILLVLSLLMVALRENKHILIAIFILVEVATLIVSIVFWVKRGGETFAIMLFSLLLSSFYVGVLAVTIDEDERGVARDCSFGSYGFYLLATVVVIVIIMGVMGCDDCSCDGCDCSGCCDCDTSSNNKKKIK